MGIREKSLETMDLFFSQERDKSYSSLRNYDLGPNDRENVSMLSKYTRYRILLESELAKKSLSSKDNEKFVKEVYWRTYWKGVSSKSTFNLVGLQTKAFNKRRKSN